MQEKFPSQLQFVIGSLNMGGAERHLVQILPALQDYGWDIRVITLSEKGQMAHLLEEKNISVISLDGIARHPNASLLNRLWRVSRTLYRLTLIFRQSQHSITHFFLPEAYILGRIASFLARVKAPLLMSRRSLNDYQNKHKMLAPLERKFHKTVDLILGNSQAVVQQLLEEHVPPQRLRLLYNGLDSTIFTNSRSRMDVRQSLNICDSALVFIIVANLIPYKGHADLLEALNLIKNDLPISWTLLCVGRDDGILKGLQEKVADYSLHQHIQWLGIRNDTPDLLMASDIGILCSHQEGFSNAVLEGMYAGLGMVVTNVGGNAEAIIDQQSGWVVPAHSPPDLAQALLALARNPAKAQAFGQAAKARVHSHFLVQDCVKRYHTMYQELIEDKLSPPAFDFSIPLTQHQGE